MDLGGWGGGHSDCGNGFPIDYVLDKAGGSSSGPPPSSGGGSAPPLHVDYFGQGHNSQCGDVLTWQNQMSERGWSLGVDGIFGPESENQCRQFQSEKGLGVDGLVGPQTWNATWTAPVT
jgi:peptidoglycan hydrolase-like protein with peptidoglycan-binding domain